MEQFTPDYYANNIATNILAGKNECGELQTAVERNDKKYFANKARAGLDSLFFQLRQAEQERDAHRAERGKLQFALETIVANFYSSPLDSEVLQIRKTDILKSTVEDALGRSILW